MLPAVPASASMKPYEIYKIYSKEDMGLDYNGFCGMLDNLEVKMIGGCKLRVTKGMGWLNEEVGEGSTQSASGSFTDTPCHAHAPCRRQAARTVCPLHQQGRALHGLSRV